MSLVVFCCIWVYLYVLQKSDKGQIFCWSIQTALGSGGCLFVLFVCLIDCHHAQKPENCPISDLFNLTPKYFLPLLHYTDLVPPFTDPVPPSTNQYRPTLTQYHRVSTITAMCWSSTTKYQQVSSHTDPVQSYMNQYRSMLTQYHQVSTITAIYWSSTSKYQQVSPHTGPIPSSINQYRLLLT